MFDTVSGPRLFYRHWKHEGDKLAKILCIHGLCCDSRIFDYAGKSLASLGYDVYAIDLPGYGNSEGERGGYAFDDTTRCINDFILELKQQDEKFFILGFSVGGLHALWYAKEYPQQLDGMILFAPWLRIKGVRIDSRTQPSFTKFLSSYIKYGLMPESKLDLSKIVPNAFSASEELGYIKNGELGNFIVSYRYVFDVLLKRSSMLEKFCANDVPTLILHGSNDWNIVPEQVRVLFDKLRSVDKELKILPNCDHWFYHSLFYIQDAKYSEEQRNEVLKTIHAWMYKRIKHVKTEPALC